MTLPIWRLSGDLSKAKTLELEAALERLSESAESVPPTLSYFEQKHTPLWRVELFYAGEPEGTSVSELLHAADLDDWPYHLEALPDKDWVSHSQALLDPVSAGRFYVHGSHDKDKLEAGVVNLTVDAGQAFGTGRHETTWACLKVLDDLTAEDPQRILDLGTGSGVLAMAAHRIWSRAQVLATDIDPVAVEVTKENLRTNQCKLRRTGEEKPGVVALTADGFNDPAFRIEGPFNLIIANILAGPLVTLAGEVARVTSHGGLILLSGLLVTQIGEVMEAYEATGCRLVRQLERGEWAALLLQKP